MSQKRLKKIRIIVSLAFFLSITLLFADITESLPPAFGTVFTSLQIIPSLLKIVHFAGFASLGLIVTIVLTLLFGRVYCSSICPLGTYQDIIIRFSRRNRKRRWYKYKKPQYALHYILLAFVVIAVLFNNMILMNLLEPFSNFGRIVHTLLRPIVIILNNGLSFLVSIFDSTILYAIPFQKFSLFVFAPVILFFALVTYLSFKHGRLFCNLLCPAGAILGLLSRISLFKMVINESSCTNCKLCEKVCKAKCIDSAAQKLDFSACIGCFNCVEACHTDGVVYEAVWNDKSPNAILATNESRRGFLRAMLPSVGAVLPAINILKAEPTKSGYDESRKYPVTPPGSLAIEHFSANCTACQLCVASCPTKVLQPVLFEYGIAGILQPKMDFNTSYCNYDCIICTGVCPSGAILPLSVEEKKLTQLGKVKFFKDDCIVVTKKKECGACSEHCPTKAVNMVLTEGLMLPEVKEAICIGCGACEHACPTQPRKAIYVASNTIHLRAEKPQVKKVKQEKAVPEEFPF